MGAGSAVELMADEEGLRGSWYEATLSEDLCDLDAPLFGTFALAEQPTRALQIRPKPVPEIPANEWTKLAKVGSKLELNFNDGWWEVTLVDQQAEVFNVVAPRYNVRHSVPASRLRPAMTYDFRLGQWFVAMSETRVLLSDWREHLSSSSLSQAPVPDPATDADPTTTDEKKQPAAPPPHSGLTKPTGAKKTDSGLVSVAVIVESKNLELKFGTAIEVKVCEDAGHVQWRCAEVLRRPGASKEIFVQYMGVDEDDVRREVVGMGTVRPAPPSAVDEWPLEKGVEAEYFDSGVWSPVSIESVSSATVTFKQNISLGGEGDVVQRSHVSFLRPRFTWHGWEEGWTYHRVGGDGDPPIVIKSCVPVFAHELSYPGAPRGETRASKRKRLSVGLDLNPGGRACPVDVGAILEVEVADPEEEGGAVAWKPAKVTKIIKESGNFVARVNGEADFLEEYSAADEGREWRRPVNAEAAAKAYAAAVAVAQKVVAAERNAAKAAKAAAAATKRPRDEATKGGGGRAAPKLTASGRKPGAPPPSLSSFVYSFGMNVEVAGAEEGFIGSWYSGEVMAVKEKLLIQYDSLFTTSGKPQSEWLDKSRLRPCPPDPAPGFLSGSRSGRQLELRHDDGWWQVEVSSVPKGDSLTESSEVYVRGEQWGKEPILVSAGNLRPGWLWSGGKWGERPSGHKVGRGGKK